MRKKGDSLSVKEEGSGDLGSDLDPDPWIRQNDADPLDLDPQHWLKWQYMAVAGIEIMDKVGADNKGFRLLNADFSLATINEPREGIIQLYAFIMEAFFYVPVIQFVEKVKITKIAPYLPSPGGLE